jgi:uncharacterized membrane protein
MGLVRAAAGQPAGESELGPIEVEPQQVRAILTARCAACHDAAAGAVEGDFGFVTDLARVRADAYLVEPGEPDLSDLWFLISEGLMPPASSEYAPMPAEEQEVVRAWIVAGAPLPGGGGERDAPPADPPAADGEAEAEPDPAGDAGERAVAAGAEPADGEAEGEDAAPAPAAVESTEPATGEDPAATQPFGERLARWLGTFHPASVHAPLGLLIGAALAAAGTVARPSAMFFDALRFCIWLAAMSAPLAAGLGWLNASEGVFLRERAAVLELHRWLGISVAAATWLCVGLVEASARKPKGVVLRRTALAVVVITAAVSGLAGYQGGRLTHGLAHHAW